MASDNTGVGELLARAILDLELVSFGRNFSSIFDLKFQKMKHEIRQNNALLLAKLEKQSLQVDKRIGHVEAKVCF